MGAFSRLKGKAKPQVRLEYELPISAKLERKIDKVRHLTVKRALREEGDIS